MAAEPLEEHASFLLAVVESWKAHLFLLFPSTVDPSCVPLLSQHPRSHGQGCLMDHPVGTFKTPFVLSECLFSPSPAWLIDVIIRH